MVEGVTLPILLHWSSIHEMRGDTTTIALPPAADLSDILYSKQTEESGSILACANSVNQALFSSLSRAWERG